MASRFSDVQRANAQRNIAMAITKVLTVWWAPLVSGVACNVAEAHLVRDLLASLGRPARDTEIDALFWFFRKKYLILNIVTYMPWVGATVQVMEVFALGQFVLACAEAGGDLADEAWMETQWAAIEPTIWSGDRVIAFYEEFSPGNSFPDDIREPFRKGATALGRAAPLVNTIPGAEWAQALAGQGMRDVVSGSRKRVRGAIDGAKGLWTREFG